MSEQWKIRGRWIGGGDWESKETFPSRDAALATAREWKRKQDSGEWSKSTQRVVKLKPQ